MRQKWLPIGYDAGFLSSDGGESVLFGDGGGLPRDSSGKGDATRGGAGPVFQLQTLGTADYTTSLLGFRYRADAEFTSYRENMEMVRYFQERGVEDIHLSLLGYEKYGLDSGAANRVRLSGALGGAKGFSELLDWCAAENVGFSVRSNMLFVGKDRWFDGFSARRGSSRTLQRVQASVSRMQPDTLEYENPRYCLSPRMYERFFERFFADWRRAEDRRGGLGRSGTVSQFRFLAEGADQPGTDGRPARAAARRTEGSPEAVL